MRKNAVSTTAIKSGSLTIVGEVHIEAKVTPRMMPGVVALGEGAWYDPDTKRVDKGGCINVLTTQRPSPLAKGNPSHTNLVQVEKV